MNDEQRITLQNMISKHNVTDQTELIRQLKHSRQIRDDVNLLVNIVQRYYIENDPTSAEKIKEEGVQQCPFLFRFYTDIFNKIRNKEIDLSFLYKALHVLEKIENNEVEQHDASFEIGTILKEMYLDAAVKKADKLDALKENHVSDNDNEFKQKQNTAEEKQEKDISWSTFKKQKLKLFKKMNSHKSK